MGEKIAFALGQYFLLGLLLLSMLGWGRLVTAKLLAAAGAIPTSGAVVLQATAGLGVITLMCIALASAGALAAMPLLVIIASGIALAVPAMIAAMRTLQARDHAGEGRSRRMLSLLLYLAIAAFLSQALIRPLRLPLGWDEIAYHLPVARAWAESGYLVVTDWLRYPLFPFNMQLLYAGALILGNDVTAHLVHALTGFLAVALTFSVARLFMPAGFALLATVLLIYAIKEPLLTADIDLGLMLYISAAFAALAFCYLQKRRNLCLLAAFFVGLALGTKYQAMFYLPALAIGFLLVERDVKRLALAVALAIATACYWYIRNFMVSGDPIHPMGGPLLGYWLWNAGDIEAQFQDLARVAKPPPWYLWPSVGSLLFIRSSAPVPKGCMVVTTTAVVVWALVSGYDRYLLPMYPMLALLSSYFIYRLCMLVHADRVIATYMEKSGSKVPMAITVVVLLAIIYDWGKSTYRDINELVLPNSPERTALLINTYPGVALLNALDQPLSGTLYQLNFEDEIYYLGTPVLGDHFGKDRYRDVMRHVGKSAELSHHLRSLGATYLMVNLARNENFIAGATKDPAFSQYFEQVSITPAAVLYKIRDAELATVPREMPVFH